MKTIEEVNRELDRLKTLRNSLVSTSVQFQRVDAQVRALLWVGRNNFNLRWLEPNEDKKGDDYAFNEKGDQMCSFAGKPIAGLGKHFVLEASGSGLGSVNNQPSRRPLGWASFER